MPSAASLRIERNIAKCRLFLSGVALIAVFVDPTESIVARPDGFRSTWFRIDAYALSALLLHLVYSSSMYALLTRREVNVTSVSSWVIWMDVIFGAVIVLLTEGPSSPFYAFFVFAVVELGFRAGFRKTLLVTATSVALYLTTVLIAASDELNVYLMRPVNLAIVGYLIAYLAQQRLDLQSDLQVLASTEQRNRIARELHDGALQTLGGINLRIESCRELLRRGQLQEVRKELQDLQESVNREHDGLRSYMRALVGEGTSPSGKLSVATTRFRLRCDVEADGLLMEHVLQMLREGMINVLRHAHARLATLSAHSSGGELVVRIDDDGVGFPDPDTYPRSIASRVRELRGFIHVEKGPGVKLRIHVPLPAGIRS